ILTIGHSNRPWPDFLALLEANGVGRLADIRTVPKSRHNPQFHTEALAPALRQARIAYRHLPALGGLRHARQDSPNTGWHNLSFRGFADYMQTPHFAAGLAELLAWAARPKRRAAPFTAIMCAEAVPWRCHRSLVADALLARGIAVEHIIGPGRRRPARLTPFAQVQGRRVTYPGTG
ncbi:MAG: DUF488 family protein, partial [Terriglobales bacterium]